MLTNPQWQGSTFGSDLSGNGYQQFARGTAWPATAANAIPGNVYDLWHAAINGRGEFFSADNPKQVYDAFQSVLARISARSGSVGNVATSAAYILTDSPPLSTADLYRRLLTLYGHRNRVWNWPAPLIATTARLLLRSRAQSFIGDAAYDGGRFAETFGWQPPTPMDEALAQTVAGHR